MATSKEINARVEQMFADRQVYETLWETAYEYIAPERAVFFQKNKRSPNEVGDVVFDSTAIDDAERLVNLLLSRLTPPWQKWFRIEAGPGIPDPEMREQLRPLFQMAEDRMKTMLSKSNFYQELQPMLLDRVVGGTGCLGARPDYDNNTIRFKATPLAEVAIQEDNAGEIIGVARRADWSFRELQRIYGERLSPEFIRQAEGDPDKRKHTLYEAEFRTAAGDYEAYVCLKGQEQFLVQGVSVAPHLLATRWTKVPGSAYGRGPGLRALADVRALNKIKELALKNAAKAVAGVYTVVDDGIVNPYTMSLEPGTFLPVQSNDVQSPSIMELPQSGNFDVAMFQMDDLRSAIARVFLADQFGPLDRTPRTATEIAERTNIVAQELGSTVARLQHELLQPLLKSVWHWMGEMGLLPSELEIDGENLEVVFVSQLAQAQWAMDEQNLLEYTQIATQFGQIDTKAGLIIDVHKALRKVAEIKGIPAEVLRTQQEIQQVIEEAAQAQAESGGMQDGME